ncbi:TRAP transporter permease [Sagittula stellata]|uniref:TRAP transporter, 4TM/12TM fusion protein n=1 Tax=Sagittula stellata (strain ATCC 700073 / DSM 11524 / E-37) TaxID=388399 RepID=A3K479_SAGS3|nr:TRAP transporter fused permease subunit [Sagittula stellata]EBA07778.1 TRAP transporter, 4TM/12TM fusion protein [Sagittula stellata E-37]
MTDTNTHADPEEGHAGQHAPVANALAALMTLTAVLYAIDLPQRLGFAPFTEQYVAVILSFVLPLVYLANPRFHGPLVWIDRLAAFIGFAACWYVAIRYPVFVYELVYKPVDGLIVAALLVVLMVEAVRRVTGLGLTIIIVAFILYALVGHLLPFGVSRQILPDRLFIYLAMDTNAMIGLPLMVASTVVFAFIFMGSILARCGGGAFFNDLALALVGRTRGGSAKIAVVSSFLFGSVSGSAVANVVASGVVTIPLMKRAGYKAHMAAATEALASTGGQLAPPIMGAAAFLMAEFLRVPYSTVVLAAVIPTALYYFAIFFYIDLDAAERKLVLPDDVEIPSVRSVLRDGWQFIVPFVLLIYTLFWLNWRPELSALAGAASLLVLSTILPYRNRRTGIFGLYDMLRSTGYGVVEVLVISAAAGFVIGVLNISGLAFSLTLVLVQLASGNLLILLFFAALVSVVLGMGMPTVGVYVLLASLIGPALVKAGIDPISAHMFLLYYGMLSMITPPVALASFTAASLAKADAWKTGWKAISMGWIAYLVPFMIVFEPGLVMQAPFGIIVWHTLASFAGVGFVTAGIRGYFSRKLLVVERVILAVAGLLAVLPVHVLIDIPYVSNVVALALGAVVLGWAAYTAPKTNRFVETSDPVAPGGGA